MTDDDRAPDSGPDVHPLDLPCQACGADEWDPIETPHADGRGISWTARCGACGKPAPGRVVLRDITADMCQCAQCSEARRVASEF